MVLEKVQIPVYIDNITENKDYFGIKEEYLKYINHYRENESDQFVGGMPVQLEKGCLSQLLRGTRYQPLIYGITLKVNGIRNLMFLSGSGIIYFIDRVTNFYYFKREDGSIVSVKPTKFPFLFDGELVFHKTTNSWEFLIFDVILYEYGGKVYNWIPNNYYDRLYMIDRAVNKDLKISDFEITIKQWFPIVSIKDCDDIYEYVIKTTNNIRKTIGKQPLEEDGLILQPFDGEYVPFREWNVYNNVQFKWKPPKQLTIDFKLKFNPENKNEWWLLTKTEQNYDVKQPDGTTEHAIIIPTKRYRELYKEGDVLECKLKETLNPLKNIFVPILKRADKTEGNSLQTIMSTLNVVVNPFTLDILKPAIISTITDTNHENIMKFYSLYKVIICSVDMLFLDSEIKEIESVYNDYLKGDKNYELELRIFPYSKERKKQNIKKFTYFYFLDFLKKSTLSHEHNFSIDITYSPPKQNATYRSTYSDFSLKNPINMVKRKVSNYIADIETLPLIFKLSLSTEDQSNEVVNLKYIQNEHRVNYNTIRIKYRDSFYSGLWRIDITKVITTNDLKNKGVETYEIECEYIGGKLPLDVFINSMNKIYKLVLKNTSYC